MADTPIYGSSSTALQAASVDPWTLPRAKKHVAGMFFALPSARPPSSSPISYPKKKNHTEWCGFLFCLRTLILKCYGPQWSLFCLGGRFGDYCRRTVEHQREQSGRIFFFSYLATRRYRLKTMLFACHDQDRPESSNRDRSVR